MSEEALSFSTEVESFLDSLFEGLQGYIYTPTKGESDYWQPYFFKWPEQRVAAVTHILSASRHSDVYVAPSVFKAPSDKRSAWKASNYVWVEFDGNAPRVPNEGIPNPTIRIQSSVKGHEHWYWRLAETETDKDALQGLSKQLTYTLDADKSGWEANQVLRPPGTLHRESMRRVRLLAQNEQAFSYSDFKNLVLAPVAAVVDTNFETVPDSQEVVAKYKWPAEANNLFIKPKQPIGSRSSALTALGFFCIEMGMTNEECYAILYNADERWRKYSHRDPASRAKRLIGIITHCRSKKELDSELHLSKFESFVRVGDFRKTELKVKWIFKDFFIEQGLGVISSMPGVGKTTLSIRLGLDVALGRDFLKWKNEAGPKRVGFLSLEMGVMECKKFLEDMWPSLSPDEQAIVEREFFILPLGYSLPLGNKNEQQMLLDEIDKHNLQFIIIDSLKAATGLDERKLDIFFDWINKHVRNERKCAVWIVHHNRKPTGEGPRKPKGLEDLYGDTFIAAHPSTVIGLWRKAKNVLEVLPFKIRLAEESDPFELLRAPHMNFTIGKTFGANEDTEEEEAKEGNRDRPGLFGSGS